MLPVRGSVVCTPPENKTGSLFGSSTLKMMGRAVKTSRLGLS